MELTFMNRYSIPHILIIKRNILQNQIISHNIKPHVKFTYYQTKNCSLIQVCINKISKIPVLDFVKVLNI